MSGRCRGDLFPFLFGGTFIEGPPGTSRSLYLLTFPFLFGGTFIEGMSDLDALPTESEISLPFRRDFH